MSKAWWDRNWDKVIVAITTTVIAGIIAHYSTIIDVKDEIAEINSRLTRVEGCIEDLLKPATTIAYKNKAKIIGLEKEIENSSESRPRKFAVQ